MKNAKFLVTRFLNPSGAVAWRVDGRLNAVRIRKNFETREEAAAEKASLDLRAMQAAAGMRSTVTFLTDERMRAAEGFFQRLLGNPRSLSFCVDSSCLRTARQPSAVSTASLTHDIRNPNTAPNTGGRPQSA
jgi:hypothetical protein